MRLECKTDSLLILLPALLFLTVFIWFDELMNSWRISKVLFIALLSSAVFGVLAIKLMLHRKYISGVNLIDLSVLLFAGYAFVRLIVTRHTPIINSEYIMLVALTGIYFVFKEIIKKNQKNQPGLPTYILIGCFLVAGLLQAGYGLTQLYGLTSNGNSYFKITGSFGNPDPYAGFLASVMPFAFGMYLFHDKNTGLESLKYLGACTLLACLLILPATYIRGAWLAAAAGMGFIIIYKYNLWEWIHRFINTTTKKIACIVTGLCIIGTLGWGLYMLKPDSAYGRLFIWKITTGMVADHPVFGAGANRFQAEYNNYQAAYFASGKGNEREKRVADNVRQTHNEYLQILAELGIAGLVLFGGILYGLCMGWRQTAGRQDKMTGDSGNSNNVLAVSATASLLSTGVLALFSFPFHILPTALNATFLLALCSSLYSIKTQYHISFKRRWIFVPAVIFIVFSLGGLWYTYTTFRQNNGWGKAVKASFAGRADSLFKHVYPAFKDEGEFLFNYGSYYMRSGRHKEAIPLLERAKAAFADPNLYVLLGMGYQKTEEFQKAEEHFKHASFMRPHKMYPRYLLAKLYRQSGETDKAVETAAGILGMEEKIETAAAGEIREEMRALIETAPRSKLNPTL